MEIKRLRRSLYAWATMTVVLLLTAMGGTASATSTASISGTITDASGSPITTQDICVTVSSTDDSGGYGYTMTGVSGNYEVSGLPADSYDVRAEDCYESSRNDLPGNYSATSSGTSTAVTLTAGQADSGIDIQLAVATSISGHIYGGSGSSTPSPTPAPRSAKSATPT